MAAFPSLVALGFSTFPPLVALGFSPSWFFFPWLVRSPLWLYVLVPLAVRPCSPGCQFLPLGCSGRFSVWLLGCFLVVAFWPSVSLFSG
ncbi:hypothetical protein M5K25_001396 [Dendrobium thyrsiflorum]|uniref:Uncharacterized protein n=1 Tax=Dendrobium thyrsiflorum TaxID=117978 RepID=A0ABD0VR97_DENTH